MERKGISYLLTIIIITISTSLVVMLYTYTVIQKDEISLFMNYSNNYLMAVSGVESAEYLLNKTLNENLSNYTSYVDSYFDKKDLFEYIYYKFEDDYYNGSFYLKDKDTRYEKGEKDIIYKKMLSLVFKNLNYELFPYNFAYIIENEQGSYVVEVVVDYDYLHYEVISKATNLIDNSRSVVEAKIALGEGYENIDLKFGWANVIEPFKYGVYCKDIIKDESSVLDAEVMIGNDVYYELESSRSSDNIIVVSESYIDISDFENNTIIFNASNQPLTLINSNGVDFNGAIISNGDLSFLDYNGNINGNIIANNISLLNSNITVNKNLDAIFQIDTNDNELYYKVLDSLGITNFKSSNKNVVDTKNDLKNIFYNAKPEKIKNMQFESLEYKIIELIEV